MDLYSSLPLQVYSLRDYVKRAQDLSQDEVDSEALTRFMLTGELHDEHQAVVDPIRNVLQEDVEVTELRDYDSMIGYTDEIIVSSTISVYPVPNPAEVLSSSVHMNRPVTRGNTTTNVPIHRIPNFQFGFWGQRHMIHIFFPSLFAKERRSSQLSKSEKVDFYELGLRPTIGVLLPDDVSDWPATYESEIFRAKRRTGYMAYQTKVLPEWILSSLATTLRNMLQENGVEWGEGFFFSHTIRGTKHGTQHSMGRRSAELALEEYLIDAKIPLHATQTGNWFIDVGVEYSAVATCLQWMTSSHFHMVKETLQIPENDASRITSIGSTKYARDMVSHLPAVSGCRIEPGIRAEGEFKAVYLQMYTTDKAITYNPEGGHHGKAITMEVAMGKTQPPKFLQGLYEVYKSAMVENACNARIEVRVPFNHATTALLNLEYRVVRNSLLGFTLDEWWGFRVYRVFALSRILGAQALGTPAFRVKREALLLTAACVWLVNGLHSRPEDGPAARNLMKAILPVTDSDGHRDRDAHGDHDTLAYATTRPEEEEEEEDSDEGESAPSVPYNPYGVVFLRRVVLNKSIVPRLRGGGPFLSPPAFRYFFGTSQDEISYKYYKVGIVPRELVAQRRVVTNKTRRTTTYISFSDEREPDLFNLAEQGYRLPSPTVDEGSDLEAEETEPTGNIDAEVSKMWRQFLIDMALKTPNPRGATVTSYFTLSRKDRRAVGEEVYQNPKLSDMWNACQYKVASNEDWKLAFNHLFPPFGHQTSQNVQNYTQCIYYTKWAEIRATADESAVTAIRQQLLKKLYTLVWIPHAVQDKMWPTSQTAPGFSRLPPNTTGPAPRILIRGKPQWESGDTLGSSRPPT